MRCIKNLKVPNIRFMIVDVDWFFDRLFVPASFDKVVINFPDPWPKERHHKHRFLTQQFVAALTDVVKPGGHLEFGTDFWPYMQEGMHNIAASGFWLNINGPGVILKEIEARPKSYFETLKKSEGENVYFCQFKKK